VNPSLEILRVAREILATSAEKEVERLMKTLLRGTPFSNKTFAVGGYNRDELLGLPSKDLDIVVEMEGGAKRITNFIYKRFPREVSRPHQMGKYPIWAIAFEDNVEYEGEIYETAGAEIEFADTQKESFPDENSRQRLTEPGTLKEDVERRDFTVNMLLKDLTTGELKDMTGTSRSDIQEGVLRGHPGVDFSEILRQDPLRMMRLVRFQAKYGWSVPLSVIKAVRQNAARIDVISGERVRDELVKVMKVGKLAQAVRFMKVLGLLKCVLPEVEAMSGVEHEYSKGYHSEGDVFRHTMLVLKNAKPGVENQLAALLHDVGKPKSQEVIGGLIKFIGHEKVGGEIAEAIMRRLKFEKKDVQAVRKMVEMHMRPHNLMRGDASTKALRKFVREVGEELIDAVLDLSEADSIGNLPPANEIPRLRQMIEDVQKDVPVSEKPPLNGNEIQNLLGVGPGREVGQAIQFLRDKMDEMAGDGKELTKPEAIRLLQQEYER
jgi:poly(A) polymerase